jgi:DUF4097 and DUF4098 domain-containing protein YvlB
MSILKGKISTKGSGDDEDWTVYLLIRAPKSASLDVDTINGPISLYDVDGKLAARTHNGPISLNNFSGEADITALNGPTSVEGGDGNVRAQTSSLSAPRGSVHSRYSCRASICDNARQTWDDENRRIEYGSTPEKIRLSTVNGPVSIRESRDKL